MPSQVLAVENTLTKKFDFHPKHTGGLELCCKELCCRIGITLQNWNYAAAKFLKKVMLQSWNYAAI